MADTLTWLQVADTAVKIGLSGIIAAVGGYMLAKRHEVHDFDREYLRRRQDIIHSVSTRFARIHRLFFDEAIKYRGLIVTIDSGVPISDVLYKPRFHEFGEALHEMHEIEADLLLVGAEGARDRLQEYRLQAVDVNLMIRLQKPATPEVDVAKITQELHDRRERFYKALSAAFRRV